MTDWMRQEDHRHILNALQLAHRAENAELAMQVARYRALLEEHGIEPPDDTAEDFLQMAREAAAVVHTASEFVATLTTSKELLADSWLNPPKRHLRPA